MLRAPREAGFTLVELLIVLTIIGLMSTAVVVAMPDPRGSVRAEAERFAARAKAARDHAVIEARPVALRVGPESYDFQRRQGREWQAMARDPFMPRSWGEDIRAESEAMIVFDPTGLADAAQVVLRRDEAAATVTISNDGGIQVRG